MKKIIKERVRKWMIESILFTGEPNDFVSVNELNRDYCATWDQPYDKADNKTFSRYFRRILAELNLWNDINPIKVADVRGYNGIKMRKHQSSDEKEVKLRAIYEEMQKKQARTLESRMDMHFQHVKQILASIDSKGKKE